MPCALRNDGNHSGAERKRLRPVLSDDVESRRSVENVNQLVLGMGLPMACPRGLAKKQESVTVTSQLRGAAFVVSGVCPRNIVSFADSASRSMMVSIRSSPALSALEDRNATISMAVISIFGDCRNVFVAPDLVVRITV